MEYLKKFHKYTKKTYNKELNKRLTYLSSMIDAPRMFGSPQDKAKSTCRILSIYIDVIRHRKYVLQKRSFSESRLQAQEDDR